MLDHHSKIPGRNPALILFIIYCCYDYSVGTTNVRVGKFVGAICKLLGDDTSQVSCCCHSNDVLILLPWQQVRACAIETLVDIYRHVGVKVRNDLQRRGLPESR